jgi:methionyl-tRNA synthetase
MTEHRLHEPSTYYVTTSIPYVNGTPHIGFALEAIQCDTLARFHRLIGDDTRFLSGTDENALTNVQAAEKEGVPIQELVDRNAARFQAIADPLDLTYDQFIRTSTDPLHFPGAQKLWRACAEAGDIYRQEYKGQYCIRCERFYKVEELVDGRCPIHGTVPEQVDEENYFFRLSKYQEQLKELILSDVLRVQPEHRRAEMLAFIDRGLEDFSISRQSARGHGWGVPVPNDPAQVMYVWVDALSNYITALGYAHDDQLFKRYWLQNPNRVHVVGKDIIRFHVVYWPAMLLSAGLPIPTNINVHEFLQVDGEKISKSRGNTVNPVELVELYSNDALRYWLLREMPRTGDGNFSHDRLIARYNEDLANDLGNLVNRSIGMLQRYRGGVVPEAAEHRNGNLRGLGDALYRKVEAALDTFDFRLAILSIWELVSAANKHVEETKPWELAKAAKNGDDTAAAWLDAVLADLIESIRLLGAFLTPFVPQGAARIRTQLGIDADPSIDDLRWADALAGETTPAASPVFPRIEVEPVEVGVGA